MTVSELMQQLANMAPDAKVFIRDADTEWLLSLEKVSVLTPADGCSPEVVGAVSLYASY